MLRSVCNILYCVTLFVTCSAAAAMGKVVHMLPWTKKDKEQMSLRIVKFWWHMSFVFSPWIKIIKDPALEVAWEVLRHKVEETDKAVAAGKGKVQPLMVIANHSTFLDVPLSVEFFPLWMCMRSRTYMGSFIYNLPIIGTICRCVGHFPVWFKSEELNSFKVDAERMVQVEADVDTHLDNGGMMSFFPEGQVNKNAPDTMMDFRYGGMKRALDCNARISMLVFHGNSKIWPARAKAAGYPGTIRVTHKILALDGCKTYVQKLRDAGLPDEEKELSDQAIMAIYMKKEMQKVYNELKAKSGGSDKKKD